MVSCCCGLRLCVALCVVVGCGDLYFLVYDMRCCVVMCVVSWRRVLLCIAVMWCYMLCYDVHVVCVWYAYLYITVCRCVIVSRVAGCVLWCV